MIELLPRPFRVAKAALGRANHEDFPMVAVIVRKGKILSVGTNHQTRTHPVLHFSGWGIKRIHAEFSAISKVKNRSLLKGCTIYIYREYRNGNPAPSKPCQMCQEYLKSFGIKTMSYPTENGFITERVV